MTMQADLSQKDFVFNQFFLVLVLAVFAEIGNEALCHL